MDLYDCEIRKLTSMLESHGVKRLPLQKEWEMTEKENLILKSETAYELGGGSSQAVSAGGGSIWGDLLCMIAQLSFSIYLTVFKGLSQRYSAITINKWMFIYASICYIPFSYQDIASIKWDSISTAAIYQVLYVVLCGSFIAYICIMTAQKLMRPTVVSMYNYVQPIVASIAAILMGIGSFGWEKGVAIALVFLGVYFVTQSKSKADLEGVS